MGTTVSERGCWGRGRGESIREGGKLEGGGSAGCGGFGDTRGEEVGFYGDVL